MTFAAKIRSLNRRFFNFARGYRLLTIRSRNSFERHKSGVLCRDQFEMKRKVAMMLLAATMNCMPVVAQAQTKDPALTCDSLKQCLAYVETPDCQNPDDCVGLPIDNQKGYFSLPDAFVKFGRPAVPKLLELLSAKDLGVQSKAAYILSESHNLQPDDLPPILKAWDAGNVWAREAIVKLGGREVAEKALRELREQPDHYGKVRIIDDVAMLEERPKELIKAFAREKPELIRPVLACWKSDACDAKLFERVSALLLEFAHVEKAPTVPFSEIYLDILRQPEQQSARRPFLMSALNAARYLGEPSPALKDRVSVYVDSADSEIRSTAISLLAFWEDKRSIPGLLDKIKSANGWEKNHQISLIGEMGRSAKEAIPEIAQLLNDDWDTRAEAARVLGLIGATDKVQTLSALITDEDWFLTYRIVESLAQLDPGDKTGKRKEIAKNYWHPVVRDIASRSIIGKLENDGSSRRNPFLSSPLFDYCQSLIPILERYDPQGDPEKESKKDGKAQQIFQRQINAVQGFDTAELVTPQKTIEGEILTGTDNGEFGGELTVTYDGKKARIFDGNIQAVAQTSHRTFAVNSLGHMDTDYGYLLELKRTNDSWIVRKVFRLQGDIQQVFQAGDKLMFVGYGASIWLDENLKPHWIACAP
jgi:HEAT repeat protein